MLYETLFEHINTMYIILRFANFTLKHKLLMNVKVLQGKDII